MLGTGIFFNTLFDSHYVPPRRPIIKNQQPTQIKRGANIRPFKEMADANCSAAGG
jgi:hypothetical protein